MSAVCPSCGGLIAPDLALTVQRSVAAANGHTAHLGPSAAAIVECLSRRAPLPVSLDGLMLAVWGQRDTPDSADNLISVHMVRIRKLLHPLGYTVLTLRGAYGLNNRSYRLVKRAGLA